MFRNTTGCWRVRIRSTAAAVLIGTAGFGLAGGIAYADPAGDPDTSATWWDQQSADDCVMMSVADVVGELTGNKPSEEEIITLAKSTPSGSDGAPIYTPGQGADDKDEPILFAHYGIHAVFTDDASVSSSGVPTGLSALEQNLAAGNGVTVAVNSETIWDQDGDHTGGDHVVVVTGVDKDAGIVHLNDSGSDEGADERVTIDTFEKAWATTGHAMVVAY
ncbi:hypothetical protein BayCH28_01670 [Mycolicibacterium sp. CH28]|uniref:C39 family peptidase n=1 Tax=Mycolicibacterium sp. CH28 TaxID=2512237 RepID=UPI001081F495|nr:C39 family peptidase [Mycolicibacterium sp. CH28]TGD90593.1 hypothetical protein BayCH28_01670 [Mycolicibacterium sp. CH28]